MDDLTLRVNDKNEVVSVETVEQEVPISSSELQRQIDEHESIIADLKSKLTMVEKFEEDNSDVLVETITEGEQINE